MTPAADRAYGGLRDGILAGRYGFGDKLGEIEIAEELGLSRTPVREALRRLGSEGLIEALPNRGARVRTWTAQDLEETYELRAVLEGLAARRAATRIGPAALARSHSHHREIVDALRAGDGGWAGSVMRSHVLAARSVLLDSHREDAVPLEEVS